MEKEEMQGTLAEIARSAEELLQRAQSHPHSTPEERVQQRETRTAAQRLEATVRKQGVGTLSEETCSCGGCRVFQGYREQAVMTSQGLLRPKRA